jgi:2-polyprenyl-3-methyl-5-hydroxy-6-metoxy-1,4-benzoquinol methylase
MFKDHPKIMTSSRIVSRNEKRLFSKMSSDWWTADDKKKWIFSKQLNWISNNLPQVEHGTALDIGLGKGRYTKLLDEFYSTVGIDINKTIIHLTKADTRLEILDMDTENLGFRDEMFDVITAIELTPHISYIQRMLPEAYRILKPTGVFFISITNSNSLYTLWTMKVNPVFKKIKHLRIQYSPSEFEGLLKIYGLNVVKKYEIGVFTPLSLYPKWKNTLIPSCVSELCSDKIDRSLGRYFGSNITYMIQK